MRLLLVISFCLMATVAVQASPIKESKPRALVTRRDDVAPAAAPSKNAPQYLIRVMPKEDDQLAKLVDFFAVGEIESPSESPVSPRMKSYGSYSPSRDDLTEALLPPPAEQNEPDYYAAKPKKTKSKKYVPKQKLINLKSAENIEKIENDRSRQSSESQSAEDGGDTYFLDSLELDKLLTTALLGQQDARDETLSKRALGQEELNLGEYIPSQHRRMDANTRRRPDEDEGARINFQMHGHNGPDSYKFGYDTGKGKNRQFHLEERDDHGNVRGRYGYYTKGGRFRIVKYSSSPETGFRIEH